ncbi:MAG: hypothetical protein PHV02_04790 [Rhodocyclaceae bacterium]|nr:hypothetical protein [Rhodocyclaceae bacterium]
MDSIEPAKILRFNLNYSLASKSTGTLMYTTPFERIKTLVNNIQKLEDKLMNTGFLPMSEQQKIHTEIKKLKEEMEKLERRTRK